VGWDYQYKEDLFMIKPLPAEKAISLTEMAKISKVINEEISRACAKGERSVEVYIHNNIFVDNFDDIIEEVEKLYENAGYDVWSFGFYHMRLSW
jgi:hypothetical protein